MGLLVSFQQLRSQKYRWEQARLVVRFFLTKSEVLVLKHHCLEWSNSSADALLVTVNGFIDICLHWNVGFRYVKWSFFTRSHPLLLEGKTVQYWERRAGEGRLAGNMQMLSERHITSRMVWSFVSKCAQLQASPVLAHLYLTCKEHCEIVALAIPVKLSAGHYHLRNCMIICKQTNYAEHIITWSYCEYQIGANS